MSDEIMSRKKIAFWFNNSSIRHKECISIKHFQIFTPPEFKLTCRLYFWIICCDVDLQCLEYMYVSRLTRPIANLISASRKQALRLHVGRDARKPVFEGEGVNNKGAGQPVLSFAFW